MLEKAACDLNYPMFLSFCTGQKYTWWSNLCSKTRCNLGGVLCQIDYRWIEAQPLYCTTNFVAGGEGMFPLGSLSWSLLGFRFRSGWCWLISCVGWSLQSFLWGPSHKYLCFMSEVSVSLASSVSSLDFPKQNCSISIPKLTSYFFQILTSVDT